MDEDEPTALQRQVGGDWAVRSPPPSVLEVYIVTGDEARQATEAVVCNKTEMY
jgi:hypothetical protein